MSDAQTSAGPLLAPVLADLADVVGAIEPSQLDLATPCAEYDVGALREHVLAWLTLFAAALQDPAGATGRPDPTAFSAPSDAAAAAGLVRDAAARIASAVAGGVADQDVLVVKMSLPGEQALGMMLWEYLVHGSDLARGVSLAWEPSPTAASVALTTASSMLSDEYRGSGKDFGAVVPVPESAPAFDRLLGFSGRDPAWKP